MATYGRVNEFDEAAEDWDSYVERLDQYFEANDVDDAGKKRSILLSVCGAKTYNLVRSLTAPAKPAEKSYDALTALLKKHYNPRPSMIVQRFKFNSRVKQTGESVADFVAELRRLSEHCQYGAVLDDMLRDRLVCGVNDSRIQRRLLGEEDGLTFKRAMDIATGMELAEKNVADLQQGATQSVADSFKQGATLPTVHKLQSGRQQWARGQSSGQTRNTTAQGANQSECFRCGGYHDATTCRWKGATCHRCKKKGHLARRCQGRASNNGGSTPDAQSNAHFLSGEESENTSSVPEAYQPVYGLYTVKDRDPKTKPIMVELLINNRKCELELDTGAAVTVINEETHKNLCSRSSTLEPSSCSLRTYTGERVKVLGKVTVPVQYGAQEYKLTTLVVEGARPNLLGRDWLAHIRLDWKALFRVEAVSDSKAPPEQPARLQKLREKYSDVFEEGLGTMKSMKAKIQVDHEAQPRFFKARPVPYALKPKIEAELDRLQAAGAIEPVRFSEWAAPIVPVVKSDKSIRICGDYKLTVNQASKLDQYPIPKTEDLLATLGGGEKFTKLDMSQAYQQLELDDDSKQYVTINTHKGLFRYNRLPFGVSSAPGIFQRTMDNLLQGIPYVITRVDDILVSGRDDEAHLDNLQEVLARLQGEGLRLKLPKCTFMAPEVTYCGQRVDKEGVRPVQEKVEAISKAPAPTSASQLKSYLGMLNFYHRYLPDLATMLAPLHELLRKEVKWYWGDAQESAFNESKQLLQSAEVLVHYTADRELVLACDASPYGVGAVLSHVMDDGSERPIAFASRTLNTAEQGYAQVDKEGLAVVFGVKKFHQYLYGQRFVVYTDHKPLVGLFSENKHVPLLAAARVQRWALILAGYEYTIVYREGKANANADAMSRLPLPEAPEQVPIPGETILLLEHMDSTLVTSEDIKQWTRGDPVMSQALRSTLHGWPEQCPSEELRPYWSRRSELSVQDGCLLWGSRVAVPPQGRENIMTELHETHPGIVRMKALARSYVWWPGIDKDLENKVHVCQECQVHQKAPVGVPMHPWEYPKRPWVRLHIDYAGPFLGKMFLIVVDAHTKWMEAFPVNSATTAATVDKLRMAFATHGLPEVVVSDNGSCFTSQEFETFMSRNGIQHLTSAPYHPASNGLAERAVQTFKQGMRKMPEGSVETKVSRFLFKYRITPHSITGRSPAEMLMNRKPRSTLDLVYPDLEGKVRKQQTLQKAAHDQHTKPRSVTQGDPVFVSNFGQGPKWLPGRSLQASETVVDVALSDGRQVRRHADHVRRRVGEELAPLQAPAGPVELPREQIMTTPQREPVATGSPSSHVPGSAQSAGSTPPTRTPSPRYPARARNPPDHYGDYVHH